MTARYQTDASLAREAAAFELVGIVGALLLNADRMFDGTVRIDLSGETLAHVVDTYNRASGNEPLAVGDVGIPVS